MNREIKFRFWNKLARRFQPASKYAIDGEGKLVVYDYEIGQYEDPVDFSKTIMAAQQFTGMVDKYGKDIYEGDYLKILNHDLTEEVIWEKHECAFGFFKHINEDRQDGRFEVLGNYTNSNGYEVVGNIFTHEII